MKSLKYNFIGNKNLIGKNKINLGLIERTKHLGISKHIPFFKYYFAQPKYEKMVF